MVTPLPPPPNTPEEILDRPLLFKSLQGEEPFVVLEALQGLANQPLLKLFGKMTVFL